MIYCCIKQWSMWVSFGNVYSWSTVDIGPWRIIVNCTGSCLSSSFLWFPSNIARSQFVDSTLVHPGFVSGWCWHQAVLAPGSAPIRAPWKWRDMRVDKTPWPLRQPARSKKIEGLHNFIHSKLFKVAARLVFKPIRLHYPWFNHIISLSFV